MSRLPGVALNSTAVYSSLDTSFGDGSVHSLLECLAFGFGHHAKRTRVKQRGVAPGCGSLGGPVMEVLARVGVGYIDVAPPDFMMPENVADQVCDSPDGQRYPRHSNDPCLLVVRR